MRLQQLDLNLFLVFEAIYRERNLTRVAQELHITQPAVSNALNRLRDRFADPLFERSPQGMSPTPLAEQMIERVREALGLLAESIEAPVHFDPAHCTHTLSFAMNDLAESLVLAPLLARLSQQAPRMSITSFSLSRREVLAELSSGRLDFAVDAPMLPLADLCHAPLMREHYVCALRAGHPALTQPWDLPAYLGLDHLHVSSRRVGQGYVDHALQQLGQLRRVQLRLQHYLVAPELVRETDLVWTLPEGLARRFGLVIRPLPFNLAPLELNLFWHRRRDGSPMGRWLRQMLLHKAQ